MLSLKWLQCVTDEVEISVSVPLLRPPLYYCSWLTSSMLHKKTLAHIWMEVLWTLSCWIFSLPKDVKGGVALMWYTIMNSTVLCVLSVRNHEQWLFKLLIDNYWPSYCLVFFFLAQSLNLQSYNLIGIISSLLMLSAALLWKITPDDKVRDRQDKITEHWPAEE